MVRTALAFVMLCLAGFLAGCTAEPERRRQVLSFLEARRDKVVLQQWDISCGAAALATILTYQHGDPVSERDVAAGMLRRTSAELVRQRLGFSLLDLKRYAETRGFAADGYGGLGVDDLLKFGPTIVPVLSRGLPHFVIFRGVQGDRVLLADPAFGNRTMQIAKFEEMWQRRLGFVVRRQDDLPAPNLLAAKPSDFWASSAPGSSNIVLAQLALAPAAPAAGDPQDKPKEPSEASDTPAIAYAAPPPAAQDQARAEPQSETREATMTAQASTVPTSIVSAPRPPRRPAAIAAVSAEHMALTAGGAPSKSARPLPATEQAPPPPPQKAARAEANPTVLLLQRGSELLSHGDVTAARLFFEYAAGLGSGQAAMFVGKTYDPAYFREAKVVGLPSNPERAIHWYRQAVALGDAEARLRLDRLAALGAPG